MNSNFTKISSEYLPTLDITLEYYEHNRTKAKHVHFASKNTENVFMVALRTMPHDSTGVAHILEHTALCGSKNFGVRDPFFSMLRRSMQTFMNAFTSSDWTAYPFATENKQDFDNLLHVYLDAVFFPNLDELDFMQEGHRFDFDEAGNLMLKWVVYNEMKGVYGDIYNRLYEVNKSLLQPETTYHYDSGGNPQNIPYLTYENFLAFHKKHYHPTNATFMTFGDIPAESHQEKFENLVLKNFQNEWEKVTTTNETRYLGQVNSRQFYPSTDTENPNQVHILFSWLLDSANNAKSAIEANIVYNYILGHSGSPLRNALENAEFSTSVSPLTLFDNSGRELRIVTGIVTHDEKYAEDTEKLIYEVFEKILKNGVDEKEAIGILDSIEMSIRELSTGYPYGLSLMLQAIGAVTHEENISLMLDPTPLLKELREKVKNRDFIPSLIQKFFIENTHKTRLVALPSQKADETEKNLEKIFCEKMLQNMSESDKNRIRENAEKLEEHQKKIQNLEILPKVMITDIPREMKVLPKSEKISHSHWHYSVATNTINYVKNIFPLSVMRISEIPEFSLAVAMLGELGFDGMDYIESQKKISEKLKFSASFSLYSPYGSDDLYGYVSLSGKFLEKNTNDSLEIIQKLEKTARFDEVSQMRNIFEENILTAKSGIINWGNGFAMLRAGHGHTLAANLAEKMAGISRLGFMKNFLKKTDTEITEMFQNFYKKMTKKSPLVIEVSRDKFLQNSNEMVTKFEKIISEDFSSFQTNEAWLSDLAVGYCAVSIPTIPAHHEDAPLLVLLGQFLRDGYLHTAIREQGGAYGSGANYDSVSQSFRFFSYRDPRIEGTFKDFENSIAWLLENNHDEERLDEAKIGVIAKIDTPNSPAENAFISAMMEIKGISRETQNAEREKILSASIDDLKNVAKKYLWDFSRASRVVITGKQNREECEKLGLNIYELE